MSAQISTNGARAQDRADVEADATHRAERTLLKSWFTRGAHTAGTRVEPWFFRFENHRLIASAFMSSEAIRGEEDAVTKVEAALRADGNFGKAGGVQGLLDIIGEAPQVIDARAEYAEAVTQCYRRRRCSEILERMAHDESDALATYIAELQRLDEETRTSGLEPVTGADLCAEFPDPPEDVVEGVVGVGEKLMLAASSKAGKTWAMLDLAAAVVAGGDWLGFRCVAGPALLLNFEIPAARMAQRVRALAERGVAADRIELLNLRGSGMGWAEIVAAVDGLARRKKYRLIAIDPIYRLLADVEENSNTDVAAMLGMVEKVADRSGAAVAFAHHFSKGSKADIASIDRASGAGAFARDPDAIITLTAHEDDDCFTVEADVRNYRRPDPFVVRFDFPRFEVVEDADPSKLKKSGRKSDYSEAQLMEALGDRPLGYAGWRDACAKQHGMSEATFNRLRRKLESKGQVEQGEDGFYRATAGEPGTITTNSDS